MEQLQYIRYLPLTKLEINLIDSNIDFYDFYEKLQDDDFPSVKNLTLNIGSKNVIRDQQNIP